MSGSTATWSGGRPQAAAVLLLAWAFTFGASSLGEPAHALAPRVATAFLLWRVWRGAVWSRSLLVGLSCVAGGLAAGLGVAIAVGASGISTQALVMFAMYAAVGALLCAPAVRALARPSPRAALA